MSKRKQNKKTLQKDIIIKRLRFFLIAALTIIIFYPPYLQGLFFEKHVLPTLLIVFITFIVFLIYKWLKNDYVFFKSPIDYACLGFVVIYFISIFVAVHTRSAIIEWLKYCMYFAVFYMVTDLADNLKTKLLFLLTIVVSAVGVSIIGLDAAIGGNIVRILNNIFKALGVEGNLFFGLFVDNRIHSTLQYPNALASYLMASFFIVVGLLIVYDKWWQRLILGAFAFILFMTFMLTQSRGAQLLFPVAVLILFIATPKENRINKITHVLFLALPAGIISLLVSRYLSADYLNKKASILLGIGLIITIFLACAVKMLGKMLQKINWKIYAGLVIVFIVVAGFGLFYIINQSVPLELGHGLEDKDTWKQVTRKYNLMPNKEYILSYEVEAIMSKEQPYVYYISIYSESISKSSLICEQINTKTNGLERRSISFRTPEDSKLISINFVNTYSGTSVKITDAHIIDAQTGEIIKKVLLKNKYNLDDLINRFQSLWLQQSVVSRLVFYKDGFEIFKDRWLIGAGGGAWNYLYRQYQSYNYASSQAHNYPLQLGIETGILGILILIALVITLITVYKRYYKKVNNSDKFEIYKTGIDSKNLLLYASIITAIAALLMHSIIDFDFSESSMLLMFWQLIAIFNRELIDCIEIKGVRLLNIKDSSKRDRYSEESKSSIYASIAISIIALYFSSAFLIASSFAKQSFESIQKNDLDSAIDKMEKAIKFDKYNEKYVLGYNPIQNRPDIKTGLVDILFMKNELYKNSQENGKDISETDLVKLQNQFSKAAIYIKGIEKKAENNLSLTSDLASYCFRIGEIEKGINYLDLAISYFPFEPLLWHSKINLYYQLMGNSFNKGEYEKAEEYLSEGLDIINEAKKINKNNMNPFVFNKNTIELLQKMKYLKDNWGSEEINYVNDVIHYSMLDLDINMDGIPDQWNISNIEGLKVSINEANLMIQTSKKAYLYTFYPLNLKKGNKYRLEIQLKDTVEYLSYYIAGITPEILPLNGDGNKYVTELVIENEPSENGNQFRIYFENNCIVESILLKKIDNNQ